MGLTHRSTSFQPGTTSAGTDATGRVLDGWEVPSRQSRRLPSGRLRMPRTPAVSRRGRSVLDRLVVHPSHARVASVVSVVRGGIIRSFGLREERRIEGQHSLSDRVAVGSDRYVDAAAECQFKLARMYVSRCGSTS